MPITANITNEVKDIKLNRFNGKLIVSGVGFATELLNQITCNFSPIVIAVAKDTCIGSACVSASGGTPPYTYLWSNGSTDSCLINVPTGYYTVTATDNSCTLNSRTDSIYIYSYINVHINPPAPLICYNDTVTLVATSTTPGVTYHWNNGVNGNTNKVCPGITTMYCVIATTSTCSDTFWVKVTISPKNVIQSASICQGKSIQVGNHTYTVAGTYIDTLVSVAGCDSIVKLILSIKPAPPVNLGPDTTLCYWQTYTLDATSTGATYLWQNGGASPTFYINSIPGTYWVKVTYGNGCTTSDTVKVNFGPDAKVIKDTILCPGQSILLNATTPGGTYLWENGSTNPIRTLSTGGYYWVKTTINSYCYRTDTVHIEISPFPVVNLGHDTILCYWQYIVLSAVNPNCQYVWQDGTTFSNKLINQTGTYWAKAIVNSGCWASDTVNITFKPSPFINLGADTVLCQGQSINLNAYVPFCYYQWQNGSTNATFNVTQAGTYKVKVSLNNTCFNEDSIIVTYTNPPTVNLGNDTNLCSGQTLTLKATYPGATYLWQNGSTNATFNVTQAGTYWVRVSINSGCFASDTIHISYNSLVNLGNDTIVCYGQTVTLNASYPNASYQWSTGASTPIITISPPYTPYLFWANVIANNCSMRDTILISFYPLPQINLGNDTNICQGQTLLLDASNPNSTYTWQNGSGNATFNVTQAGTYWVVVKNNNNCISKDTINITYTASPSINLGNDTSLCPEQTITLIANFPNASYLWQDNSTNASFVVSQQGVYWVEVSTSNNCKAADTINIIYNQNPVVNLGPNSFLCPGQTLVLDATINNGIYQWQDGSTSPTFTATRDGVYEVIVIDTVTHCKNSSTITLDCDLELVIPNIITPNGDGYNDCFVLTNSDYWNVELQIYDRWGLKVHEDGNYQNKFDGTSKGNPLSDGTYFYNIKAKNKKTGKDKYYHGSLTILR